MRSRSLLSPLGFRLWPVAASISVLALVVLSLLPAAAVARTSAPPVIEHAVAYAGSAALATLAWGGRFRPASIFCAYVALAAALESLQRFSPGRSPELAAFAAGAAGAALGVFAATLLVRSLERAAGRPASETP